MLSPMLMSDGFFFADYHVVVEGLGGKGLLLTRKNEDQMDDIIRTAQSKCRSGQPILLNALIGKTTFREGSIAMQAVAVAAVPESDIKSRTTASHEGSGC